MKSNNLKNLSYSLEEVKEKSHTKISELKEKEVTHLGNFFLNMSL